MDTGITGRSQWTLLRNQDNTPSFLVNQYLLGRIHRLGADARINVFTDTLLAPAEKDTILSPSFKSLPYDSQSLEWKKAYDYYFAESVKEAKRLGTTLYLPEDEAKGKRAVAGQVRIRREWASSSEDFSWLNGVQRGKDIWLTGIDYYRDGKLWVSHSPDSGNTWSGRQLMEPGNFPEVASSNSTDLLLFYSKVRAGGYTGEWPDDGGLPPTADWYYWFATGKLTMKRSKDGGKAWDEPKTVFDDPEVIQCSSCVDPSGKIWLVYVQSHKDHRAELASLWLSCSEDAGLTWKKPVRLTDGTHLDREPDLIFQDGALHLAFSRAGRVENTSIWVMEGKPEAFLSLDAKKP